MLVVLEPDEASASRVTSGVAKISTPASVTVCCFLGNVERNRLYQANAQHETRHGQASHSHPDRCILHTIIRKGAIEAWASQLSSLKWGSE
jgi:hypothetical protein